MKLIAAVIVLYVLMGLVTWALTGHVLWHIEEDEKRERE